MDNPNATVATDQIIRVLSSEDFAKFYRTDFEEFICGIDGTIEERQKFYENKIRLRVQNLFSSLVQFNPMNSPQK